MQCTLLAALPWRGLAGTEWARGLREEVCGGAEGAKVTWRTEEGVEGQSVGDEACRKEPPKGGSTSLLPRPAVANGVRQGDEDEGGEDVLGRGADWAAPLPAGTSPAAGEFHLRFPAPLPVLFGWALGRPPTLRTMKWHMCAPCCELAQIPSLSTAS